MLRDESRQRRSIRIPTDHPDWQALLFGALIRSSRKTDEPADQQVRYQSLAPACALNRPYTEDLAYNRAL
jgi:hypothetical protein